MLDEALDAAETFGEREEVRVFEKTPRTREVGVERERNHAAETGAHLALRQLVLRVRLQTGIVNARDFRLCFEPAGDFERVRAVALHAQGERLESAQRQKAIERPGYRADRVLQKRDAVAEFLVALADHRDAGDEIGVAVEIFRRRMNDDIEAQFERALNPRARERVVRHRERTVFVREARDDFEIGEFEQRIARRFDPHHFRLRLQRVEQIFRIREIDECEIEVRRVAPHSLEQAKRAAVKIVACHDVAAAVERVEHGRHRRKSRGKRKRARAALEVRDATLEGAARRIDRARVVVAFVPARTFLHVSRGLVNRHHDRTRRRVRRLAGVNDAGGESVLRGALRRFHGRTVHAKRRRLNSRVDGDLRAPLIAAKLRRKEYAACRRNQMPP